MSEFTGDLWRGGVFKHMENRRFGMKMRVFDVSKAPYEIFVSSLKDLIFPLITHASLLISHHLDNQIVHCPLKNWNALSTKCEEDARKSS